MKKIEPISFNEYVQGTSKLEKSPKDIVIFNFDDQNPVGNKKQPYEVKFDKDGYPIPDGEILTKKKDGIFSGKILYKYVSDGTKTYSEIRDMFNLKVKALKNNPNNYGVDDDVKPDKGRVVCFYSTDVDIKK